MQASSLQQAMFDLAHISYMQVLYIYTCVVH